MKKKITIMLLALMLVPGCASFIQEESRAEVMHLEENTYRAKVTKDTEDKGYPFEELEFKRGQDIRIIIRFGDDWVKVYGYADTGENARLKENRYLILYMFREDFPDNRFDPEYFKEKLFYVLEVRG